MPRNGLPGQSVLDVALAGIAIARGPERPSPFLDAKVEEKGIIDMVPEKAREAQLLESSSQPLHRCFLQRRVVSCLH